MRIMPVFVAALLFVQAAQAEPVAGLAKFLPIGSEVEARVDADFTGDGFVDAAAVAVKDDVRVLVVVASSSRGLVKLGQTEMDPGPLGTAQLTVARGVLIVEDLTGGTTALSSTYRWRYDPAVRKMRLIGDDVSLYSRTWAHDGKDISTNRLTGVQIVTLQKLKGRGGNASYVPSKPIRKVVSRDPIYMGGEPSPSRTMGWGD
ncbi:hypothetical protein OKA06_13215 [Novosphingobium sp. MW5]|nr:hypothetical protein [Novosphingobium sp. MW5]